MLQSEQKQEYEAWQSSSGAATSPDDDEVFELATQMRNSIEKRGQAGIEARKEMVEIPENPDPFSGTQWFGLPEWGRPTAMIDVYYVEGTSREVVSFCEQYLGKLTRLINDFEHTHTPT